ncbi:ATP-binding protein [Mucilaginibacter endophyticus]|uniref:ATP-binding protein n=1 Tax=Mucilaginibacter endophyticus TaxID=2675003 RepID=UPI000E0DF4CC|nr:serine/threonine protein kinase [Mucilaginibacter endophyticus]
MVDATYKSFDAVDRSYHALIKKHAHQLALKAELPETRMAELDIVVAEHTSNLAKYAQQGELLIGHFKQSDSEYIELISLDNGPGMSDVPRMMADGFSSTNTIGHGLGSIKRLSDEFDIFSVREWGTIVVSRIYRTKPESKRRQKSDFRLSGLVVAKPNESTSGDGYYLKRTETHIKLLVADGLGHGPEANHAVNEAVKAFKTCPHDSPVEIIRYLHPEVRKTRGLVGTVVCIDLAAKQVGIAGVGNISAKLIGLSSLKSPLAYNGIIGHNIPNTMNDLLVRFEDYHQLTLCSDGIRSRWEAQKFPGLARADLSIQAAAIYKDNARRTDDMSVITLKF